MKYHIAVKFLAVALAALCLMGAVFNGFGIVIMADRDMLDGGFQAEYAQSAQLTREDMAFRVGRFYAAIQLGGCPDDLVEELCGTNANLDYFKPGYYGYRLLDAKGKILESYDMDRVTGGTQYEVPVKGLYPQLIAAVPEEMAMDQTRVVAGEVETVSYFDTDVNQYREVQVRFVEIPDYTLELTVLPGGENMGWEWQLLEYFDAQREYLLLSVVLGLALFAVLAVYLCCVAGRGSKDGPVQAGGLNRMSLDVYGALTGIGLWTMCFLGYEISGELVQQNPRMAMGFIMAALYAGCLLFVGFCFAFAAQVKMPGSYWWHNSLVGRCLDLVIRVCRGTLGWLRRTGWPLVRRLFRAFWKFLRVMVVQLWLLAGQLLRGVCFLLKTGWRWLKQGVRWVGKRIGRFLGLLPLTWQWLIVGFAMIGILIAAIAVDGDDLVALAIALVVAVLVYASYAFGVLLESARQMGRGELDRRVDDRLLVGCFREFGEELNGLNDVVKTAAQKQLKSERMKTELITNVSHDIKTPLTSIINYVDLLGRPHTEQEQTQYLEVLQRQSQRMKKLIDDLMELSKASSGNLNVDITPIDAKEAVNQALGEFTDKLEAARLTPVFRHGDEDVFMLADGRLAWRVMSNLLSNAVKYALPGTRLYVDLTTLEGKVMISMKNISREQLNVPAEELMERFVRGDAARNTEGSGLGLNIARSLMELQHGQLQLLVDGDLFKVTLVFPRTE